MTANKVLTMRAPVNSLPDASDAASLSINEGTWRFGSVGVCLMRFLLRRRVIGLFRYNHIFDKINSARWLIHGIMIKEIITVIVCYLSGSANKLSKKVSRAAAACSFRENDTQRRRRHLFFSISSRIERRDTAAEAILRFVTHVIRSNEFLIQLTSRHSKGEVVHHEQHNRSRLSWFSVGI